MAAAAPPGAPPGYQEVFLNQGGIILGFNLGHLQGLPTTPPPPGMPPLLFDKYHVTATGMSAHLSWNGGLGLLHGETLSRVQGVAAHGDTIARLMEAFVQARGGVLRHIVLS